MSFLRSCWRGMDRLGWSLMETVVGMNGSLEIPEARPSFNDAMTEYARVRTCIASSVHWIQV